ncbi:MAG: nuclear transport factor 2 family protein [Alphaproteobacteria bacterium]|nr:nuclear transport factor 2 family protein [Alphaproteobacteria bacterium]
MILDDKLRGSLEVERTMDATLAERIGRREQIEALKQLKYRYCAAVDANYDAAAIASMFAEDGVWDRGDLGYISGRDAIYQGFLEPNATVKWMTDGVTNPIIEITGDRARCQWYMWLPKITNDGTSRSFQGGTHVDQCRRLDGQWLFEHMQVKLRKLP